MTGKIDYCGEKMFKNLTIGKKIGFGFASILVLTAVLSVVGIVQMRIVDTGVMDLANVHIPLTAAISEIDVAATAQNLQVSLYAIHKEDVQLEEFATLDEAVDQNIEVAQGLINSDEELVAFGWLSKIDAIAHSHDVFVKSC